FHHHPLDVAESPDGRRALGFWLVADELTQLLPQRCHVVPGDPLIISLSRGLQVMLGVGRVLDQRHIVLRARLIFAHHTCCYIAAARPCGNSAARQPCWLATCQRSLCLAKSTFLRSHIGPARTA